jgi:hypothetical protein
MRDYQSLNKFETRGEIIYLSSDAPDAHASLALTREGDRVAIAASIGALELALRLHYDELKRHLNALTPVSGLTTTRQIGNVAAYISAGIMDDGKLVLRPTLVSDATGHITINLLAEQPVAEKLLAWLNE